MEHVLDWSHYPLYALMLGITVAASVTDLRRGTISNRLIKMGLRSALVVQLVLWVVGLVLHEGSLTFNAPATTRLVAVALNASVGVVIAFALYSFKLWSAGDGKLSIFLALAQPAWLELSGPLPWAPITVVLGNALVVGLIVVAGEALLLGTPRLWRALTQHIRERRWPLTRSDVFTVARVVVALVAFVTALSPIRQRLSSEAGELLSGGSFLAFLLLMVLYKPLRRLTLTTPGLIIAVLVLVVSVSITLWLRGLEAGATSLASGIVIALAVVTARGIIGASSRTFDSRAIDAGDLTVGMVLSDQQVQRMEQEPRWQEAFMPHMDELRSFKLCEEHITTIQEWHQHNVPDEKLLVRAPLPFAPALAVAVLLTALTGRLLVPSF